MRYDRVQHVYDWIQADIMNRLAIIVPVKSLPNGKPRLAGMMSATERHALNLRLLRHTLDEVAELADIAGNSAGQAAIRARLLLRGLGV